MIDPMRIIGCRCSAPYTVSYTYVDSRFTASTYLGNQVPYVPHHQLYQRLQFRHPLGFDAQVSALLISEQYSDNANTVSPTPDGTVGIIGPRVVIDAQVGQALPWMGLKAYVSVKNLTDEKYISTRFPQGIQPGTPRMVMLGLQGGI